MKYYKIINPDGHNGLVYHEGYNEDPLPFNPKPDYGPGGIHFAREDILAFIDLGTDLYEVDPVGPVVDCWDTPKVYKAHAVNLKYIGKVINNIKFLVRQGANIHVDGEFPLKWSIRTKNAKLVRQLIKLGADIHYWNDYPLFLAFIYRSVEIAKILLEAGADPNNCDGSCLVHAVIDNNFDMVKLLLEKGASIHICNDKPLRTCVSKGTLEMLMFLIEQGADVHADNDFVLRRAVETRNIELCRFLVKRGVNFNKVIPRLNKIYRNWFRRNIKKITLTNK